MRARFMSLAAALALCTASGLADPPPAVTETQKYTTSVADEQLGQRLSCRTLRCSAETASQHTRYLVWNPSSGWTSSSVSSTHAESVDDGRLARVHSTTVVSTAWWWNGASYPDSASTKFVFTDDAEVLALDEDRLAVSRRPAASVELYSRNPDGSWSLAHTYTGFSTARFGFDVDIQGDTLVIGIPSYSWSANTGEVSVYDGFDLGPPSYQQLTAPEAEHGNTFGAAVALWGDWLAVGAPTEDTAFPQPMATDVGAVFLFERGPSGFEYRSTIFGEVGGDEFGSDVDFQCDTIVVGAPLANGGGLVDSGMAYVYRVQGGLWFTVAELQASDTEAGDRFGTSVAVSGPGILVGAPFAVGTSGTSDAGGVYFFAGFGTAVFIDGFESGDTTGWSGADPKFPDLGRVAPSRLQGTAVSRVVLSWLHLIPLSTAPTRASGGSTGPVKLSRGGGAEPDVRPPFRAAPRGSSRS